jgi:CHAT domain-containing protein/tetratricopeptide (TPR) repeat protein
MSARNLTGLVVLCAAALLVATWLHWDEGPVGEAADERELTLYDTAGVRLPLPDSDDPEAGSGRRGLGFGPAQPLAASSGPLSRAVQALTDGRFDRAIGLLERAVESDPADPELNAALSAAYLARGLDARGDSEGERAADLAEALDRIGWDPGDLPSLFNRALALEALYCYRMAAEVWESYLERDSGSEWGALAAERLDRVREVLSELDRGSEESPVRSGVDQGRPPSSPEHADALTALRRGIEAIDGHRVDEAEKTIGQSLPVLEAMGDPRRWHAEEALARVDYQRSLYDFSERRALRALTAARHLGDRVLESRCLWTLANLNFGRLSLQRAHDFALERLELGRALEDRSLVASAAFLLSRIFDEMGDPDTGWEYRVLSFRSYREAGDGANLALAIQSSSFALARQERFAAAADFASEMLAVDRAADYALGIVESLWVRASHRLGRGDGRGAQDDLAEAKTLLGEIDDAVSRDHLAAKLLSVDGMLASTSDPEAAVGALSSALEALERSEAQHQKAELLLERARVRRRLGRLTEAAADLDQAIRRVARHRSSIDRPLLRVSFLDLYDDLADEAIAVAVARGRTGEAFRLAESMKGVMLRESLGASRDALAIPPAGWRPALAHGDVLVSYWAMPDELLIWAVRPGEAPTLRRRPVSRGELAGLLGQLAVRSGSDRESAEQAAHRILLAPLDEALDGARRLIVVPDRFTREVPWAALRDDASEEPVVDRLVVRVQPTAIAVRRTARLGMGGTVLSGRGRLVAIADPRPDAGFPALPGSRAEVAAAARRFPRAALLVGADATRSRFLEALPGAEVIQVATHFTAGEAPWSTRIVLADDGSGADPDLPVHEIAALDLTGTRLAILSGCASGREGQPSLEGTYAAAGAFLAAGVEEVVATLWPVDDRASLALVTELYDRLEEGYPVDEALREAQRTLAKDSAGGAADWAAFQLISLGPPEAAVADDKED